MERRTDSHADARDTLCVQLLGTFRITSGQRVVTDADFRVRNAARLVKLLALAPDHARHREEIMDWLWPDLPPDAAANNLRYTLYIARRALRPLVSSPGDVLRLTGQQIQLAPPGRVRTDVEEFEHAVSLARGASDLEHWSAAAECYAGELLPGDRYEDWAAPRRESLRETYIQALATVARLSEQAGDEAASIDAFERAVALDTTHEEAYVGLMRLYAQRGQRQLALRQYGRLRDALHSELSIEPEAVTQQLYQAILLGHFPAGNASNLATLPAPAAPPAGRHNLPAPQDRFVGRDREIPEISGLLQATRFLTLIGSGGVGKTRLALQVARQRAGETHEDIWFIDLAALTDASRVPGAVSSVLDIAEAAGSNAVDQIIAALESTPTLLILDNCEHLLDAVASLASGLLAHCPALRVLTTSREPLRVSGEVTYRAPSLTLPQTTISPAADLESQPESVQLFVTRAARQDRAFQLTADNAETVADICRKLDGIPLAIELAAARVSTTPLERIAARLGDALPLLTSGERVAPARHQTLRGALDWSYDLLSNAEQRLFRSLAVFSGGWTLEAAEVVGEDEGDGPEAVIDLLASLVDRSLVNLDANRLGLRYRMLEPVRQYATERLRARDGMSSARTRHARYMAAFVTAGEPGLRGRSQGEWISRFEAEHDNLRAALDWTIETDPHIALSIAAGAGRFWYIRSYGVEGRRFLREVLEAVPDGEPLMRARALSHAGILADEGGDHQEAAVLLQGALDIFREMGDERGMAAALNSLGAVARSAGDLKLARQRFQESLTLRRTLGDEQAVNLVKSNLAAVALNLGDLDSAESLLHETLPFERASGDEWSVAISLAHLGRIALARGDYLQAIDTYIESNELAMRAGDQGAAGEGLAGVAGALGALGRTDLAARLWGAAEATRERLSLPIPEPDMPFYHEMIAIARASANDSAFEASWARGRSISLEEALVLAQEAARLARSQPSAQVVALTARERDIASLIAQGQTNGQIAVTLGIAVRTVDTHVGRILRKLGASSRTEVIAKYTEDRMS